METQLFRTMDTLSATFWFIQRFASTALTGKASIGEEIGETHGCGCDVGSGEEEKGTKIGGCCGLGRIEFGYQRGGAREKKIKQKCAVLMQPHHGSPSRGGEGGGGLRHEEKNMNHPA